MRRFAACLIGCLSLIATGCCCDGYGSCCGYGDPCGGYCDDGCDNGGSWGCDSGCYDGCSSGCWTDKVFHRRHGHGRGRGRGHHRNHGCYDTCSMYGSCLNNWCSCDTCLGSCCPTTMGDCGPSCGPMMSGYPVGGDCNCGPQNVVPSTTMMGGSTTSMAAYPQGGIVYDSNWTTAPPAAEAANLPPAIPAATYSTPGPQ